MCYGPIEITKAHLEPKSDGRKQKPTKDAYISHGFPFISDPVAVPSSSSRSCQTLHQEEVTAANTAFSTRFLPFFLSVAKALL